MDKYDYDGKTRTLEITGESITALDIERIRRLSVNNVYKIYIHNTSITDLPNLFNDVNVLSMFENVNILKLSNNKKLTTIQAAFVGAFPRLKQLEMTNNKITHIPTELFSGVYLRNLKNLELFNLSNNELTEVPEEFSKLPYLVYIDFSHNELSALPTSLEYYSRLNRRIVLNLNNNNFNTIPLFLLKPQEDVNPFLITAIETIRLQKFSLNMLNTVFKYLLKYGIVFKYYYNKFIENQSIKMADVLLTLFVHYVVEEPPSLGEITQRTMGGVPFIEKRVEGRDLLDYLLARRTLLNITSLIHDQHSIQSLRDAFSASFNPEVLYTLVDITTSPVNLFMDGNPLPEIMYSIDQPYTSEDYELLIKYTIQSPGAARDKNELTKQLMSTIFRGHFNPVVGDNIHARHASPSKAYKRPIPTKSPFSGINPDAVNQVYDYIKEPIPIISRDTRNEYNRLKSEGKLGGGGRRRTRRHRRRHRRRYTRHRRYNKR